MVIDPTTGTSGSTDTLELDPLEEGTGSLSTPSGRRAHPSWLEVAGLVALLVVGGIIRAKGFTSLDLWFDDAWAAAPARVGLGKAIHMVLTAPGFGLALREWIRIDPLTTWWAQIPSFVLGLVAIPATYWVVRSLRFARWIAASAAVVVTVSPILVQYSTRVKEYPFDLIAACVLLALADRARRQPTTSRLRALGIASVVTFLLSAGAAPVIAGVWLAVLIVAVIVRETRRAALTWLAAVAVGCAVVYGLLLRKLPAVLNTNWRRRGFLVDYRSFPRFERSVTIITGGFVHGVFAYPVPWSFFHARLGLHTVSAAAVGALLLIVAVGVPLVQSIRARAVTPALPASLSLAVAVLLAAADKVPFGDGRTDEALYPVLLVCLAATAELVARRVTAAVPRQALRTAIAGVLAVSLLTGAVAFGVDHPAVYPTLSLRGLYARLKPLVKPDDTIFVDTFNSFAWCYYELTPCTFKVGGTPVWPQGFSPRSDRTDVFIASHYGIPLPEFTAAQAHANQIWYVGYSYGTFDVGAGPKLSNLPVSTFMTGLLKADGWRAVVPTSTTQILGDHVYAILMVRTKT